MMPAPLTSAITFLPCRDLDQTTKFYSEFCGLEMVLDQGSCRIWRIHDEAYIGFCMHTGPVPEPPDRVVITFVTEDVPTWYDHLTGQGVKTDGPPRITEAYEIEHFFAFDPTGYRVEVQRFLNPAWNQSLKGS